MTPWSLVVTPWSLILTPWSLKVTPWSLIVAPCSLIVTPRSLIVTSKCLSGTAKNPKFSFLNVPPRVSQNKFKNIHRETIRRDGRRPPAAGRPLDFFPRANNFKPRFEDLIPFDWGKTLFSYLFEVFLFSVSFTNLRAPQTPRTLVSLSLA